MTPRTPVSLSALAALLSYQSLTVRVTGIPIPEPIHNCPFNANALCHKIYDPVLCSTTSSHECEYDNQCLATAADESFTIDTCTPVIGGNDVTTPMPDYCPMNRIKIYCGGPIDPVTCNDSNDRMCHYDNPCYANEAIMSDDWMCMQDTPSPDNPQVDERCPKIPTGQPCTEEYNPQTCTSAQSVAVVCNYDNTCYSAPAADAGWTCTSEDFIQQNVEDECPAVPPDMVCIALHDPRTCTNEDGKQCQYQNECYSNPASEAGYTCIKDGDDGSTGTVIIASTTCPRAGNRAQRKCKNRKFKPVLCGTDECEYDNMCLAKKKGFKKRDCVFKNGCGIPSAGRCRKRLDESEWDMPVVCDGAKCHYQNQCVAESAGYDFETECTDVPNETGFLPSGN